MSTPAQTKSPPLRGFLVLALHPSVAERAWLEVSERSARNLEALLVLRSNGSGKRPGNRRSAETENTTRPEHFPLDNDTGVATRRLSSRGITLTHI